MNPVAYLTSKLDAHPNLCFRQDKYRKGVLSILDQRYYKTDLARGDKK